MRKIKYFNNNNNNNNNSEVIEVCVAHAPPPLQGKLSRGGTHLYNLVSLCSSNHPSTAPLSIHVHKYKFNPWLVLKPFGFSPGHPLSMQFTESSNLDDSLDQPYNFAFTSFQVNWRQLNWQYLLTLFSLD